ncbi:Eisosome component PIL1/LSP1 [Kalmanozyma brasiliensis GHG001]|uniref:Uncharacterized protein n=1 Tax=Kalmanozyma brasiliensis (strain GHG001) TaxID=1365824 RepID=V5EVR3_KALBG|nr:Eisosome component PIL1/LSP1 [Kalmanozyma brasiliensis GHG001]EST07373.1 Eisosome component PIL1/LSP1 [Kalmanozyma brasiliensis GHG001]
MSFLKKAQQQVAHTSKLPALGNQDRRQLQDVINSEKTFIQSNTKAATDFKKNAEALKAWSAEEGPDLNDVAGKISLLYDHYSASQNRLNAHLATVRLHFKSIRTREEALSNLKSRKRSLGSDIEKVEKKLAKMGPENKELTKVTTQLKEMRGEMEGLHIEVMNEEAAIGDFKRRTVREALGIKSGALLEMAEKLTIVAEISKLMLDEIPQQPTRPGMPRAEYYGFAKTESLLQEATRSIADVGFHPTGQSAGIPRFNDMTLADTTGNMSRDTDHAYANDGEVFHDMPSQGDHGEYDADPGYNPPPNRGVTNDDVARTPIYAQHAARSQWAQEGAAGANAGTSAGGAAEVPAPDASTHEWAQSSYERGGDTSAASAAAAAAMAATAGADLNAVPGHGDPNQPDAGFLMQNSQSHAGSGPNYGSNRNSGADYSSAQGGNHAAGAPSGLADVTASTEGHQSDAYDGYTAGGAGNGSSTQHEPPSNPTAMLGAPTLPPVRTATPLTNSGAPPVSYTSPTATDDSAYFQSIGGTRALQEAVRAPMSPAQSGARLSSYGALGSAPPPQQPGGEGKKVTAAAFRRGFSRNPSGTPAGMSPSTSGNPYDDGAQQQWASNPLPQIPNPHAGGYANSHDSDHASVPPLHIQKRLSNSHNPLAAAAAAGTPQGMQGRRYSGEYGVSGDSNPAPPYLGDQGGQSVDYGQGGYGGYHPQHMQHPQHPQVQRQQSSQYAEYAAPPPPGYGYA